MISQQEDFSVGKNLFHQQSYSENSVTESLPSARIDSSWTCGTLTLETYYLNFIARQLYAQNSRNSRKIQYWPAGFYCAAAGHNIIKPNYTHSLIYTMIFGCHYIIPYLGYLT